MLPGSINSWKTFSAFCCLGKQTFVEMLKEEVVSCREVMSIWWMRKIFAQSVFVLWSVTSKQLGTVMENNWELLLTNIAWRHSYFPVITVLKGFQKMSWNRLVGNNQTKWPWLFWYKVLKPYLRFKSLQVTVYNPAFLQSPNPTEK